MGWEGIMLGCLERDDFSEGEYTYLVSSAPLHYLSVSFSSFHLNLFPQILLLSSLCQGTHWIYMDYEQHNDLNCAHFKFGKSVNVSVYLSFGPLSVLSWHFPNPNTELSQNDKPVEPQSGAQ